MKEPDIEGVATHGGPKSCVGVREGGGEALTGVRAGWAIEPRNQGSGVPTPLTGPEGNIAGSARREPPADPARSENLCMRGISMHENREVPRSPAVVMAGRAAQGRPRPQA
jgi:RNA-directed DNA polymerase